MKPCEFLVADLSNSNTKLAPATSETVGDRVTIPTRDVTPEALLEAAATWQGWDRMVVASVVPEKCEAFREAFGKRLLEVTPDLELGVAIEFPDPSGIGPDRLVNAAGCAAIHGYPAVVVDFGTAVTFDILSDQPAYVGGVIAPGLDLMREYLHSRTALLPLIDLEEPPSPIGKSTREAMLAGAVIGYRGLVREIILSIAEKMEVDPKKQLKVVATGGYSELIAKGVEEIDAVDQDLTLQGLRIVGSLNPRR